MEQNISSKLDFYRALRVSVTILTHLGEAFSCFNLWIITPKVSDHEPSNGVTPLVTTVAYAILEPLATRCLVYVAIRPWILLLALSPIHLYLVLLSTAAFDELTSIRNSGSHSKYAVPSNIDKAPLSTILRSEKIYVGKTSITLALIIPVLTAALINAALVLFSQSLYAASLLEQNPSIPFLATITITINLICRLGDYIIWSRTQQQRSPDQIGYSGFVPTLARQVALITIRACMRMAVGLPPLMAFETPTPSQAEIFFGSEQYYWLEQVRLSPLAQKFQLGVALGGPLLMLLSGYLIIRGLKEDSSTGSE